MEDMLKCEKKLWNWIFKLKLFDYYRCYGLFFFWNECVLLIDLKMRFLLGLFM